VDPQYVPTICSSDCIGKETRMAKSIQQSIKELVRDAWTSDEPKLVRFTQSIATSDGGFDAGETRRIPGKQAAEFLRCGFCIEVPAELAPAAEFELQCRQAG
jgi:hypothetical protein